MTATTQQLITALRQCITSPGSIALERERIPAATRRRIEAVNTIAAEAIALAEAPRLPDPTDLVCPMCGSNRVQYQAWVRADTGEVLDGTDRYDWCDDCGEDGDGECSLITREEYQEREKAKSPHAEVAGGVEIAAPGAS